MNMLLSDTMDGANARIALMRLSADKPAQAEIVLRHIKCLEDTYDRLLCLTSALVGLVGSLIIVRFWES